METFSGICFMPLFTLFLQRLLSLCFLKCFEFECFLKGISVYTQMLRAWKLCSEFSSTDISKIYHCLEMQVITTQTVDTLEESLAVKIWPFFKESFMPCFYEWQHTFFCSLSFLVVFHIILLLWHPKGLHWNFC